MGATKFFRLVVYITYIAGSIFCFCFCVSDEGHFKNLIMSNTPKMLSSRRPGLVSLRVDREEGQILTGIRIVKHSEMYKLEFLKRRSRLTYPLEIFEHIVKPIDKGKPMDII